MAQTHNTPQGPMVLIDAKTRRLAPASVTLGPDGMPPPGYALSSWYMNEQNFPIDARTGRNTAPVGNVGTPNMNTSFGVRNQQSPMPGGITDGFDLPSWWPEWIEPPTFGGTPQVPMPPSGGGATQTPPTPEKPGGILPTIKDFVTDPKNLLKLAGVVTALTAGMRGGGGSGSGSSPDVQRLNAITEQRMRRVDPLHQAVTQLAWGRLPTNARQGIAPPTNTPLP